jgi:hypothetical protein
MLEISDLTEVVTEYTEISASLLCMSYLKRGVKYIICL